MDAKSPKNAPTAEETFELSNPNPSTMWEGFLLRLDIEPAIKYNKTIKKEGSG